MAPTPRPDGWKGGSEDFGFVRTLDGNISSDRFATGDDIDGDHTGRNARKGFEQADLSGDYLADDA